MLTTRRKGNTIYVRGTVRVGKEVYTVKEHSTGTSRAKDAAEYVSKLEADVREAILNPKADRTDRTTFDDCVRLYMDKKKLKIGELQKINILLPYFEGKKVSEIQAAWVYFRSKNHHLAPATQNRYAATLNAILNSAKQDLRITPPHIAMQKVKNKIVFLLTPDVRKKLLSVYSKHAKPIFTVMAYQGFREQELLQMDWENVHLKDGVIIIPVSKNGETRSVPMNKRTYFILAKMWLRAKKPSSGRVFLNIKRKPYTDTRIKGGGSPLRKAQITALANLKKRYGIDLKMRIHDWRHDWAARIVMSGVDMITLQELGGWKSVDMVARYAAFSQDHKKKAINKI